MSSSRMEQTVPSSPVHARLHGACGLRHTTNSPPTRSRMESDGPLAISTLSFGDLLAKLDSSDVCANHGYGATLCRRRQYVAVVIISPVVG
jgi:hypothetical protein